MQRTTTVCLLEQAAARGGYGTQDRHCAEEPTDHLKLQATRAIASHSISNRRRWRMAANPPSQVSTWSCDATPTHTGSQGQVVLSTTELLKILPGVAGNGTGRPARALASLGKTGSLQHFFYDDAMQSLQARVIEPPTWIPKSRVRASWVVNGNRYTSTQVDVTTDKNLMGESW